MQTSKIALLFPLLLSVGCGPAVVGSVQTKGDQGAPVVIEDHHPTQVKLPTMEAQIEAAKNGHLTCEFKDECEPALALVSIATESGLSRCTGFLISDHEVLTNDHCLDGISDDERDCRNLVYLHFSGDVHRGCKKISVRSGQKGLNTKDYAVIELSDSIRDRDPLRLSRRGFHNGEMATIFRVQTTRDPIKNTFDGIQTKLSCQASYPTMMNINVRNSKYPVMTFGDCAIQEGNSGSPMLNESGEVSAVNQGFLTIKDDSFSERIKPYLLDGSYGQVAIGTQVRCMPEIMGRIGSGCEAIKPISALYPEDYLAQYGNFSKNILPRLPYGGEWKDVTPKSKSDLIFVSAPVCISMRDAMTKNFRFTSNVMSYHLGINSRLQTEWRSKFGESEKFTMFTIQANVPPRPSKVEFTSELTTISVPVCLFR